MCGCSQEWHTPAGLLQQGADTTDSDRAKGQDRAMTYSGKSMYDAMLMSAFACGSFFDKVAGLTSHVPSCGCERRCPTQQFAQGWRNM